MFASFFDEIKNTPSRVAERREDLTRRARRRVFNARGDGAERFWSVRTSTLERVETILGKSAEVPVIGTLTAAANKLVQSRLDSLTALPIEAYETMNAKEAIVAIKAIDNRVALCSLRRFEAANKNRKTILAAIEGEIARIPAELKAA